jgi:hypothetical protein
MECRKLTEENPGDGASTGQMTIQDICALLRADIICCEDKVSSLVYTICGCDLMSDVLAFTKPGSLLLTGLTNNQVVRTAEILDLKGIVFVRGKKPDARTIAMAKDCGIPLLSSPYPLYESCGLLYTKGLKGCTNIE